MKTTNVFGTQEQQDAAWKKAWRDMYGLPAPTASQVYHNRRDTPSPEWVRKYQAACYSGVARRVKA